MMRVVSCLGEHHVLWLLLLSAVLCLVTSLTAMRLLARGLQSRGEVRAGWVLIAGVSTGAGVWTTHFLAMLAYDPGLPVAYSAELTMLSLIIAAVTATAGCAVAVAGPHRSLRYMGGAVVGFGIAAMHFTGMAALRTQGVVRWDPDLTGMSIILGVLIAALAYGRLGATPDARQQGSATRRLALAILVMHFTAMGAITIVPDPRIAVPPKAMSDLVLAFCVTAVSLLVLGAGNVMDLVHAHIKEEAQRRFHALTDSSADGGVVTDGDGIVYVNAMFRKLMQTGDAELIGRPFIGAMLRVSGEAAEPKEHIIEEGVLRAGQDAEIPVEVLACPIIFDGKGHSLYSLRDLRERRQAQSKIRFLAENDALTGLPNRGLFQTRLQDALERGGDVALFFIDLARLKDVNDLFGNATGDALLRGIGARLRNLAGDHVRCARLGGDKFAVMQAGASPEEADRFAGRIIAALLAPFVFSDQSVAISCGIGIAMSPRDGESAGELFARAETALRRAKQTGAGNHCFYDAAIDEEIHRHRALAHDLGNAIAADALDIHYQPLAVMPSMEFVAFEALLRGRHPECGMIPPGVFIPIAENTNLICELGVWVLRKVCLEASGWANPLTVAVNLSPVQLDDTALPETVQEILLATGMPAKRLELEVTETALMRNPQRALDVLRRLKALGIRIAIDDFGTGYSSLSTLQAFPFDKIKIDKSFVERVDTHAQAASIVKAVLGLGRSLEIPVVVEGVETQQQLDFLRREGAVQIQGYFIGRPQPIAHYAPVLSGAEDRAGTPAQKRA